MQDDVLELETGARLARCAGLWGARAVDNIRRYVAGEPFPLDDDDGTGYLVAAVETAIMAAHCARPMVEGLALGRLYGAGRPS
mgnify:CR=1 FL=1